MWLQRFTSYLLKHRIKALAITFVSAFLPVVGIVSILIAALMTLLRGAFEGSLFMLAATLPYLIGFYAAGTYEQAFPLAAWAAVGVAVLSNLFTWVFATMLQRRSSWSDVLQVATLVGVLAICLIHFAYPDVALWWGEALKNYAMHVQNVANVASTAEVKLSPEQLRTIGETKWLASGLMVSAVLFNAVLQLIVARWWQALLFQPGSLKRELRSIRLSRLAAGLFLMSIAFWYIGNSVIYDILPVLFLLFAAAGLSLVHYLFGLMQSPTTWFWLVVFYVVLFIAMPISVIAIAGLGLLDVWFDFRKRLVSLK